MSLEKCEMFLVSIYFIVKSFRVAILWLRISHSNAELYRVAQQESLIKTSLLLDLQLAIAPYCR